MINVRCLSLNKLKSIALDLQIEIESDISWFKRRKLRRQLKAVMDEIDYQEGRKQFANRPYSKPPVRSNAD